MKKRITIVFLIVSMSFSLFYPNLALNDNVLRLVDEEEEIILDGQRLSVTDLMKLSTEQKKVKFRLWEILCEFCK